MGLHYGWEKFHLALSELISDLPIRQRVINATSILVILSKTDLPTELQDEFDEFLENVTSVNAKDDEGTIEATINTYSSAELESVAKKILHFYNGLCRAQIK